MKSTQGRGNPLARGRGSRQRFSRSRTESNFRVMARRRACRDSSASRRPRSRRRNKAARRAPPSYVGVIQPAEHRQTLVLSARPDPNLPPPPSRAYTRLRSEGGCGERQQWQFAKLRFPPGIGARAGCHRIRAAAISFPNCLLMGVGGGTARIWILAWSSHWPSGCAAVRGAAGASVTPGVILHN